MTRKKWILLLLLTGVAIGIRLLSAYPELIENQYATGVYPFISAALKVLFGWLPFSFGDIIYWVLVIGLIIKCIGLIRKIVKKQFRFSSYATKLYPAAVALLLIYISFNVLWGLNYNRQGIKHQLQLTTGKYTTAELVLIDSMLAEKVNESKAAVLRQTKKGHSNQEIFDGVKKAYDSAGKKYPYLTYSTSSIKSSLWGWAGNYLGFTGYYNPFSGEAQVNTTVPRLLLPFTSCHEVAHQLGYAKENEANFVGYLAALSSTDSTFHYSTYLDLFLYAQANLQAVDSNKTKHFYRVLLPQVKDDLKELKEFSKAHKSPAGPLFRLLYGLYLRNNQQPSGMLSYDEVTGFLIAYYQKFGRI